jgi:outer membrane protein OmpA-like peptidoglycan-associated protein
MNRITTTLLGATTLALLATPALAEKRDRLLVDQYRDKIAAARAEPGVAENGSADLDRATAELGSLTKRLDNNDVAQAKAVMLELDALIETARTRAKIAGTKSELAQLKQQASSQMAAAQAEAQQAKLEANAARAETAAARAKLEDYQMKQTALGATLVLQDVVFETGKADLKPGAAERLRPLAQYLAANPDVKVRVDGHTDAQGSDSYNQDLSERRAQAIRTALSSMSIDPSRIQAIGHGESSPLADNKTATGRQQNRRVEITLMGQNASNFAATTN